MKNPIGTAKMTKWPKVIRDFIAQAPEQPMYFGQSQRSTHRLLKESLAKADIFISYNEKLDLFVAWNAAVQRSQWQIDEFYINFSLNSTFLKKVSKISNLSFEAFYKQTGMYQKFGNVYEKILVFSPKKFEEFFFNYAILMKPKTSDNGYVLPVFDFLKNGNMKVLEEKPK
ncbi:MAG: hypothetical protein IJC84_01350 [Clostridia bacterium]|nr:hypothetical protein [Clostridia bacterium]